MRPGEVIGHYTIESHIGCGGMGDVYLALDTRLHRKVAIKIIQRENEAESQEGAMRLLREARTAASLTHPNIVSVFDVGEHDGRVFLAMEYVIGKTLREYVGKPEPSWSRRVRWLLDVARALAAAHKKNLVHRDIKPENVMVRDEDGLIKVLDFGIARRAMTEVDPTGRTEAALGTLTGKGQIIGTPMYMAPEQIKGTLCDARSDQFAWGVVAFELLAGRRPWPEKSDLLAAVAQILTEPPASLAELAPDVPELLHDVVHRAISRDAKERFSSMEDIAEMIESHAAGSSPRRSGVPVQTTKKSIAVNEPVEIKRPQGRISDPSSEGRAETRNAMVTERSLGAEPPPPEPPKTRRRFAFAAGVAVALLVAYGGWRWSRPPPPKPTKPIVSTDAAAAKPPTENPEALRLYNEGMQLFRDGAWSKSRRSFEASEKADPSFPAPSLMLALMLETNDDNGRDAYQRALLNRTRLSDSERGLLDAMDPIVMGVDPDFDAAETRAVARVQKAPNDALAHYWLGWVREQRSQYEEAKHAYERSLGADATFVPARRAKARVLLALGNPEAALSDLDACVKSSPAAAICLRARLRLYDEQGQCQKMETDAREWATIETEATEPDYHLAVALAAQKAPTDAVLEALRRRWKKMPPGERSIEEPSDQADVAILLGDFTAAERASRAWQNALGSEADVLRHAQPTLLMVHLAFESGDSSKAADLAEAFEKRMKGLPQRISGPDPSLKLDEFLYRANRLSKPALEEHRKSWLARAEAKETQHEKMRHIGERWATIYASFAETLEEANDALSKYEEFQPMPPTARQSIDFAASVGKTYALAGKFDDALPYLERVTRSCSALRNPAVHTRAFFYLGLAKEGKGDLAAAKAAYKEVVDRWGAAKPKSVTADKAKARLNTVGP